MATKKKHENDEDKSFNTDFDLEYFVDVFNYFGTFFENFEHSHKSSHLNKLIQFWQLSNSR